MISVRNFVIFGILLAIFAVKVYPFLKYMTITFDRYYFGWVNELEPPVAMTT